VTITSGPPATTGATATVAFTISEGNSTCSIDGAAYVGCASPYTVTLAAGAHTLTVQSFDASGNRGFATRNWTVVCTAPTTGPGAVAFFHMDDAANSQTVDNALTGPDAVLGTTSAVETADPTRIAGGRYGSALRYVEAESDTVTWPSTLSTHDFTIEMWVKSIDNGQWDRLFHSNKVDLIGYAFNGTVSYQINVTDDSGGGVGIQTPYVPSGVWHHVVATYTGTTIAIYIDGTLADTSTAVANAAPFAFGAVSIGRDLENTAVGADIDEVFVGNQAFTLADVQTRYCPAP
jgi:hypothetical protein